MAESSIRPNDTLAFPMAGNGSDHHGAGNLATVNIQRRPRHNPPLGSRQQQQSQQRRHPQDSHDERGRAASDADFETIATEEPGNSRSRSSSLLPSNVILSPRADVWIYLCASSFVGVASLARAHARYNQLSSTRMVDSAAVILSLLIINATLSLGVGVAYRFRPSLTELTRPFISNLSLELLLAAVTLLLWTLCMIFYNATAEPAFQVMMEMYSPNDWNANFFYSLWITGILSLYLVADLCAGNYRAGVITTTTTAITATHAMASLWMLLFFSSILLLSFSIAEKFGPICNVPYLQNSPYCVSTTVALVVSVLGMLLCLAHMATSHFNTIENLLALAILIGYACNAGITTSPGGSGANVGNVYIASWLSLILALILNVNYLGLHFTNISSSSMHHIDHHRRLDNMARKTSSQDNESDSEEEEESEDEDEDETLPPIMHTNTIVTEKSGSTYYRKRSSGHKTSIDTSKKSNNPQYSR